MNKKPVVSVVLGSYNRHSFLKLAIQSVRESCSQIPHETIVIDGGSTDRSLYWLVKQKDVITIIQHNHGEWQGEKIPRRSWGYFMNLGFKAAQGKYILMISDDSILHKDAVQEGIDYLETLLEEDRKVGAVAFYFRAMPARHQSYFVHRTPSGQIYVNHGLYLRSALEEIDWIDEETYQFYCADMDLCLRLQQHDYEVIDCQTAFVEHYEDPRAILRTTGSTTMEQDHDALIEKWKPVDPAFGDAAVNTTSLKTVYADPHYVGERFLQATPLPAIVRWYFRSIMIWLGKVQWLNP